ncbi:flagellin [Paracoccus sp. R12_1]|jgi:flagellin|uniref:Flagellin n=1 Tax=Paracoccus maritimus TaxID=2933292 RepID=A0ABT2KC07_9RHOB|nr:MULTISPECIES: flagellin [unclassified Paracoccus (in: a-proteobacteria)]MBO9456111.1 flagellin [Paracoccus sp. R12_2]MBO9487072.1 flagellin [Paracoccus sp. R12_1]MCT4334067.1 flagellin [Paracoccus sp. YLB-12]
MSSILTNNGAIVALQTLKSINAGLDKAQSEISTGKSIANAQDNAAIWAISKVMETDQAAFKTIQSGLNVAEATVATARAGAEQVTDLLNEMKNLALNAGTDGFDYDKVQTDITAKMAQITSIVSGTQMNGVNLLSTNGIDGGATFTVLASLDRSVATAATTSNTIVVDSADFEASIVGGTLTAITDRATADTAVHDLEVLIEAAVNGAADLGSAGKRIADQSDFVGKLADSLKAGIGSLVDADMEEASARLQALQTQQQLGIQSLSIANQAPSSILALFR